MPFNIEKKLITQLRQLRHRLHAAAEVSGDEKQTAEIIVEFLKATNPDKLQTGVGGHGILATYGGENTGADLMIRCELDGLPITDDIKADYQSETEGVGHKCGHDGHMAIVAGVATLLGKNRPKKGSVTLLFQPAEETGEGARRVMDDPQFKDMTPDYCFALHNLPDYKKHQIVVKDGTFAAASVGLKVTFTGSTAHAAHPEEGRSPALAVAQTMQAFSAIPQFYIPLEKAAKVTVIHAKLGEEAFGTSPGKATVMATLRTYDDEMLELIKEKCIHIAKGNARAYDLEMNTEWVEPFAATVNDAEATQIAALAAEKLKLDHHYKEVPFSWSEDFGHFTQAFPGAMFGLGAGKDQPALHAQEYDFPDEIIATGVNMFMEIINEAIDKG